MIVDNTQEKKDVASFQSILARANALLRTGALDSVIDENLLVYVDKAKCRVADLCANRKKRLGQQHDVLFGYAAEELMRVAIDSVIQKSMEQCVSVLNIIDRGEEEVGDCVFKKLPQGSIGITPKQRKILWDDEYEIDAGYIMDNSGMLFLLEETSSFTSLSKKTQTEYYAQRYAVLQTMLSESKIRSYLIHVLMAQSDSPYYRERVESIDVSRDITQIVPWYGAQETVELFYEVLQRHIDRHINGNSRTKKSCGR